MINKIIQLRSTYCQANLTYNTNLLRKYYNQGYIVKEINSKNGKVTLIKK